MQKLRRWAAAALCGAAFAGSAAAVLAACALCPGRAWIVRGALFCRTRGGFGHRLASGCRPGRLQAPEAGPPPHARAHGDALPGPDGCGDVHAGAVPASTPLPSAAPELDDAGRIRSVTLKQGSGDGYVALAAGSIRNSTEHPDADLRAAVTTQNLPFAVEKNSILPQVLIMHTHATESYQTWPDPVFDPGYTARSKSTALNMCAVGENGAGAQRGGHPHAAR
ncbi:stage II sporulation protein P [Gemmiger formicilis]|nr:stage II sporulation protein P [Gemmiger formicilis]